MNYKSVVLKVCIIVCVFRSGKVGEHAGLPRKSETLRKKRKTRPPVSKASRNFQSLEINFGKLLLVLFSEAPRPVCGLPPAFHLGSPVSVCSVILCSMCGLVLLTDIRCFSEFLPWL